MIATLAFLLIVGALQPARAEVIDSRPYPLLEFFLAHECIDRDIDVTTLIEASVRSAGTTPDALLRAYQLVSQARRVCAAGHVKTSLAIYSNAVASLCAAYEPRMRAHTDNPHSSDPDRSICERSNIAASSANGQEK